jgi:hypothetical protein
LYVNGALQASTTEIPVIDISNAVDLRVGALSPAAPQFFAGTIDEVQLFSRALSALEIAAIYDAGSAGLCDVDEPPPPPCVLVLQGFMSWWPGDGDANDLRGSRDGVLMNGAIAGAPGVVDRAFQFDGVDDFVEIAHDPALNFGTGDFSVNFWVMFDDLDHKSNGMVHKTIFNGFEAPYNGWLFNICDDCGDEFGAGNGDPGVGFETREIDGTGPQAHARWATTNFERWRWYHLTGVRQSNVLSLYVDGVLRIAVPEPEPTDVSTTQPMGIGQLTAASLQTFFGLIDEVQMHSRALTAMEVATIYGAGVTGHCRPPIDVPIGADAREARLVLSQNAPNPFERATTIRFALATPGAYSLVFYNAAGERVWEIAGIGDGDAFVEWNGASDAGERVAAGTYIYQLRAGGRVESRRLTIVR